MRIVFARALHVRHVAEGSAEFSLLVGAMRTPVQAIHPGILAGEAFGEGIVFVILVISASEKRAREKCENNNVKNDLVPFAAVALTRLLPFSSLF